MRKREKLVKRSSVIFRRNCMKLAILFPVLLGFLSIHAGDTADSCADYKSRKECKKKGEEFCKWNTEKNLCVQKKKRGVVKPKSGLRPIEENPKEQKTPPSTN